MKLRTLLLAAAAGAAVAYFMDAERGAQRRATAKERAEHIKAQALPKLQELRAYRAHDDAGESEFAAIVDGHSSAVPN